MALTTLKKPEPAAPRADAAPAGPPVTGGQPRLAPAPRMVQAVSRAVFRDDADYARFGPGETLGREGGPIPPEVPPLDYLLAGPDQPLPPGDAFARMRWGGQYLFVSPQRRQVAALAKRFSPETGFYIDHAADHVNTGPFGLPIPLLSKPAHFFVARKVALIPPGSTTDRFTFDVRLVKRRAPHTGYVVSKQVPTYGSVVQRLRDKFPEADIDTIVARARKLVDRVFPVFLTREAAFLKLLQRDLPEQYKSRVPQVLAVEKGPDKLVRRMHVNWLRMGGSPLPQLEFARQASDLLRVLHDEVGLIHLDLRLDNVVITPDGVGFVDFGSAVRVNENLKESPMLRSLFDEMMSTSQIQRVMGRMKNSGKVTSEFILNAYQRVDKAVDLFYLAVQMRNPHTSPDLKHLIEYDKQSDVARRISLLTDAILRPSDPKRPNFIAARDVLGGLNRIERKHAGNTGSSDRISRFLPHKLAATF